MVLFCHITTQIPDEPYDSLLRALTGRPMFPTILILDDIGTVIGEHTGPKTVEAFEKTLGIAKKLYALMNKDELTQAEKFEKFLLEIELGRLDYTDAEFGMDDLGELTAAQKKQLAPVMANLEADDILQPPPRTPDQRLDVGEEFAAMAKAGRIPTRPILVRNFWNYQMIWAEANGDVAVAEAAAAGLKKLWAGDEKWSRQIADIEKRLAAVKSKSK